MKKIVLYLLMFVIYLAVAMALNPGYTSVDDDVSFIDETISGSSPYPVSGTTLTGASYGWSISSGSASAQPSNPAPEFGDLMIEQTSNSWLYTTSLNVTMATGTVIMNVFFNTSPAADYFMIFDDDGSVPGGGYDLIGKRAAPSNWVAEASGSGTQCFESGPYTTNSSGAFPGVDSWVELAYEFYGGVATVIVDGADAYSISCSARSYDAVGFVQALHASTGIDMIRICNGETYEECKAHELKPTYPEPVPSNINCTSNEDGNSFTEALNLTYLFNATGDLSTSYSLNTDIAANCGNSNVNGSWIEGTTTGGTSHVLTLPFDKAIECGDNQLVYFNCSRTDGLNETYFALKTWACDAGEVGGEGNTIQTWMDIMNYDSNATHLWWNLSLYVANFYGVEKSFNIPAIPGYTVHTGTDPLVVGSQQINSTHYINITTRPLTGDEEISVPAIDLGGGNVTNSYTILNAIDPPHSFMKDGLADCSLNTTITSNLILNKTLVLFNPGVFRIDGATLTVDDFYLRDSLCVPYITNEGILYTD